MAREDIERCFPALASGAGWVKTSEESEAYNCFAWAAGLSGQRLDPSGWPDCHWPTGVSDSCSLSSFVELFASLGFEPCGTPDVENGYVKIALYHDAHTAEAMHAARQLPSGSWSSKIGDFEDIRHDTLESLESYYGIVAGFVKKKLPPEQVAGGSAP